MSSKFYRVSWASPLGDKPDQHGNNWQSLALEGVEPKIAILVQNAIQKDTAIYGRVEKKTSQKGNEYYRFYREQLPEGVTPPVVQQSTPVQAVTSTGDSAKILEELGTLQDLLRKVATMVGVQEEVVLEDIEDEPDLSDIPF